jgi:hypothetical protein
MGWEQPLGSAMHALLEIHGGLRPDAAEDANCFHIRSLLLCSKTYALLHSTTLWPAAAWYLPLYSALR